MSSIYKDYTSDFKPLKYGGGDNKHLPHVMNTQSGANRYDPMHRSIFEVYFTLPRGIADAGNETEVTLTEQVTDVSGLDALQKTVQAGSQKFFGVDVSFLNPTLDNTYAEITINFNLNIRNATDAWVLRVFKAWEKLGYNLADGVRTLKAEYIADNLRVAEANRNGDVFRAYCFHDVMVTNVTGLDTLNYTDNEPAKLAVTFRSDWWQEDMSTGGTSSTKDVKYSVKGVLHQEQNK